ncbi:hypothetical protein BDZ89DRAFT_992366 [Hymenopellis radicata]|nr:hypothetical protein BDZ89DRAFT_992366 [Hymenopellis radicata]
MGLSYGLGAYCFWYRNTTRASPHDLSFAITPSYPHPRRSQPISRSPRSRFPLEIVLAIIEHAQFDDSLQVDRSLLRACSLVCTEWSTAAQKLLFRNVILRSSSDYASLQMAVDSTTAKGRVLGDAIRHLRVILDHNQPLGLSERLFAEAVLLCPNLRELNLSLFGSASPGRDIIGSPSYLRMRRPAPSFDEGTLALLRCGPQISRLQFTNWSDNQLSLTQLLSVWPMLASLSIGGTAPELPPIASEPFPCALAELNMNFQHPPSLDFMDWLLHNSTETLRVVGLEQDPSTRFLEYLVDMHGSKLESVSLPSCSHDQARALHRCSALRQLIVESPLATPLCYRNPSHCLEHMALGLNRMTPLQGVMDSIKSQHSLKAVTVHLWGGEEHSSFSSLKIACAYRGIPIRVTRDIRVFRRMLRGDLIQDTEC